MNQTRRIDKTKLINKLRGLEGLTNEEKSTLMALINEEKRYGLVWEDSPEEVEENLRSHIPVLREVMERTLIDGGADAPNHILIEGDNLDALTALSYTHEGCIDVIYIDPPYNTGNKDFKYNDDYVDTEDSYRHSKWLSFMNRRLRIAKRLLSDKGVIFISIDYYSFAQLKLLCDGIFEHSSNPENWNFKECLIWNKQHSQQQGTFKRYHEFVLVYAKNSSLVGNVLTKGEGVIEAGAMKKISKKNPASCFSFPAGVKFEAKDGISFTGTYGESEKVTVVEGVLEAKDGKTLYPVTLEAGWTQKAQMKSWFSGYDTIDTKGQKIIEFYFNSAGKIKCRKDRGIVTPCSILPEFGMGSEQTSHLENILGEPNMFSNPKPVEMIKLFCDWFCPADGIILDYFAGSGTTLEATMQLNAEDGGHRQCILVTNNENGICENVTYERNKRVIQGYTTPKGQQVEGLHNNNLRYYKIDYTNRSHTHENRMALAQSMTELLQIKNGTYETPAFFGHLKVKPRYMRYFRGNNDALVVYFPEIIPHLVNEIKEMSFNGKLQVYIAIDGNYPFADEFAPVASKVDVVAIPSVYYHALKHVLPDASGELIPDDAPNDEDAELLSEANKNDYQD